MMRNRLGLVWLGIIAAILPLAALAQDAEQEFWNRVDQDAVKITAFIDIATKPESTYDEVVIAGNRLVTQLDAAMQAYENRPTFTQQPKIDDAVTRYVATLGRYRAAVRLYADELDHGTNVGVDRAIAAMGAELKEIDRVTTEINEELKRGDQQNLNLMLAGTLFAGVISGGLFVQSRRKGPDPLRQEKAAIYFGLFKTSLVPLIGGGITLGTYLSAWSKSGGSYVVATGAIIFGAIQLLYGLFVYFV